MATAQGPAPPARARTSGAPTLLEQLAGGAPASAGDGLYLTLTALALLAGPLLLAAPLAVLLAFVPLLLLVRARRVQVLLLTAALACGALRGAATLRAHHAELEGARAALGAPGRCAVEGTIARSPVVTHGSVRFDLQLQRADCDGRRLPEGILIRLYGGPRELARGDVVHVVAQLAPARSFRNLELVDPAPASARRKVVLSGGSLAVEVLSRGSSLSTLVDRARAHARRRIDATYPALAAPMARALVLGENDLTPEDDAAFKRSGLAHLLAVSGSHLVIAVASLVGGLGYLLRRIPALAARIPVDRLAAGLGIPLALLYADFAGGSGSAWRAAWMLAVAYTARALGRRPLAPRVLGASLLVAASLDPLAIHDLSLLLSAAATAGLLVLQRPLESRIRRLPGAPLRTLGASFAATLAALLPCAPLLALISDQQTLAGIGANVVAAPFGELAALPACLLHVALAWWPLAERGCALVGAGALLVVRQVALVSASLTWLAFPVPAPSAFQLAASCVLAGAVLTRKRWWIGVTVAALLLGEALAYRAGHPRGELRVTMLDVGQGDATLIDLPDGAAMLVDGGGFVGSPVDPGERVLLPVLRARRRRRIDVVALSHPHPDHFTGLVPVLRQAEVGELWITGQGEAEGAGPIYAELLTVARRRGVRVRHARELCGLRPFHGLTLAVLAPCPTFTPHRPANDNSLVMSLRFGRRRVLLTGDAEAHQEQELLRHHGAPGLRADLLKVGHHGSRTSSSEAFLDAVGPAVATISCGRRNRYGHPHAVTLEKLQQRGIRVFRLDDTGAVRWVSDGESVWVRSHARPVVRRPTGWRSAHESVKMPGHE